MRRLSVLLSLVAIVMLGALTLSTSSRVLAQDATPASDEMMEEEGVTFMPIGFAEGVTLPSAADLLALHLTIDPGAVSTIQEDDPTSGLLVVDSGTFTIRVDAEWSVSRGAAVQQMMEAAPGDEIDAMETIPSGEETTLAAGDTAYIPGNVAGELRNDGQEPAIATIFLVLPGGSLSNVGAPEATPAA